MTANAKALAHAQLIITELIETILAGVEYPMEVSKLEGDAVFLYCMIDTEEWADPAIHARLCDQLLGSFAAFADRVVELNHGRVCGVQFCRDYPARHEQGHALPHVQHRLPRGVHFRHQ